MNGTALQIIDIVDNQVVFNRENLQRVLNKCGNRPLVIYSVAGKLREGKSFLLNLFLFYNHNHGNWIDKRGAVTGFEAKGGSERVTSGILLWSEPLFKRNKHGQEVAILLMDTQGTFDNKTTTGMNSFIFGFSMVVSSVIMYNVRGKISEQELDSLLVFALCFNSLHDSYQGIKFLIRDWTDDDEYPFGSEGGEKYIRKMGLLDAETKEGSQQHRETREMIKQLFRSITCFLLPLPGNTIQRGKKQPTVEDTDVEFKEAVDELCQELFEDNLIIRESTQKWTAGTLIEKIDRIVKEHQLYGTSRDPGTHLETFQKKVAHGASQYAFAMYKECVENALLEERKKLQRISLKEDFILRVHVENKTKAFAHFYEKTRKFGPKIQDIENDLNKSMKDWTGKLIVLNRTQIEKEKAIQSQAKMKEEFNNYQMQKEAEIEELKRTKNIWKEVAETFESGDIIGGVVKTVVGTVGTVAKGGEEVFRHVGRFGKTTVSTVADVGGSTFKAAGNLTIDAVGVVGSVSKATVTTVADFGETVVSGVGNLTVGAVRGVGKVLSPKSKKGK